MAVLRVSNFVGLLPKLAARAPGVKDEVRRELAKQAAPKTKQVIRPFLV